MPIPHSELAINRLKLGTKISRWYVRGYGCYEYTIEIFLKSKTKKFYPGYRRIGLIELVYDHRSRLNKKAKYITHSFLYSNYWRRGLGILLYSLAADYGMKHGFRVVSSDCYSENAERVWESARFRKYYRVKKFKNNYECFGPKKLPFKPLPRPARNICGTPNKNLKTRPGL